MDFIKFFYSATLFFTTIEICKIKINNLTLHKLLWIFAIYDRFKTLINYKINARNIWRSILLKNK